jgi:hypothetical protein
VETNPVVREDLLGASTSIADGLAVGRLFAGRVGETELAVWRRFGQRVRPIDRLRILAKAKLNAGIWPPTKSQRLSFSMAYERSFSSATHVGLWGNLRGENDFLAWSAPTAQRIPLRALDPVMLASTGVNPWSTALAGMAVMVVAPFAQLGAEQMARRTGLFRTDFDILPQFDVVPLEPPQTQALALSRVSWSQGLQKTCRAIDGLVARVDVALISAGSYGMPLAAHAAGHGIPVVYVGGALQLLFGIAGSRWASSSELRTLAGEGWVRQAREARPRGSSLVEQGAYW